jgi:hypothetical protein
MIPHYYSLSPFSEKIRAVLAGYPELNAWMDRIKAFGHGAITDISADEALAQAQQTTPRPLPEDSSTAAEKRVRSAPADYGCDAVSGALVAESETSWIIARELARCGRVHVHFPKQGFLLQ